MSVSRSSCACVHHLSASSGAQAERQAHDVVAHRAPAQVARQRLEQPPITRVLAQRLRQRVDFACTRLRKLEHIQRARQRRVHCRRQTSAMAAICRNSLAGWMSIAGRSLRDILAGDSALHQRGCQCVQWRAVTSTRSNENFAIDFRHHGKLRCKQFASNRDKN